MKFKDLQLESIAANQRPQFVVIQTSNGRYRVDPDPLHHKEDWENAWNPDISKAHVFSVNKARKFLGKRASSGNLNTEREARRTLNLVPVQVVNGVASLPTPPKKEKRRFLSWLKAA